MYIAACRIEKILDRHASTCVDRAVSMEISSTLSQLDTDAERLLVPDALDTTTDADACSTYVDDTKMHFGSPWSLACGTHV